MNKKYYATRDGFVLGNYYAAGASMVLTQEQAKYLTSPLGDEVTSTPPAKKSAKPSLVKGQK